MEEAKKKVESEEVDALIWAPARFASNRTRMAVISRPRAGRAPHWPPIQSLPAEVPELPELDMSRSVAESRRRLRKPRHESRFLRELGYFECNFEGTREAKLNPVVHKVVKPIQALCPDFGRYQRTSTRPADVFDKLMEKIDRAPVENHPHMERLWAVYRALADFIGPGRLRKLRDWEIYKKLRNKKAGMGWQERNTEHETIGDYVKSGEWKAEVERFKRALMRGQPIKALWSSVAKLEPKRERTSARLIWYLCATARIYEARLFGHIDDILRELPYSVCGLDLADYGEALAKLMRADAGEEARAAVCDDVQGWDTKVSYSLLCMEAEFLRRLAPGAHNRTYRREIARMYSIYANALVSIKRPARSEGARTESVLYQLRGQVPSGRRVTYAMNTITNIVVSMSRAAYSQGVSERDMYRWALARLRQGHSAEFGGKLSGDDSVVVLSESNAHRYATEGAKFMNEIGMPRKNVAPDEPSHILAGLEQVHFCNHSFVRVRFPSKGPTRCVRWMPVRPVGEIVAKSILVTQRLDYSDPRVVKSFARQKGLDLLVHYFPLKTVRLIAQALLSITPTNLVPTGEGGCRYRRRPWLKQADILRACNERLFGERTHFPSHFRLASCRELGLLNEDERRQFDINHECEAYRIWEQQLPVFIWDERRKEPMDTEQFAALTVIAVPPSSSPSSPDSDSGSFCI